MSKRPFLIGILLAGLTAGSASGQLLGGGGQVGGVIGSVGQTAGGVGGRVGSTVNGVGGRVGGTAGSLGGTVGGLGGRVGSTIGGLGAPVGGTLDGINRSVTQSITGLEGFQGGKGGMLPISNLNSVDPPREILYFTSDELANWRQIRLDALIRMNPDTLDRDEAGQPVRKNQLIAVDPDPASLAAAQRAGFRVTSIESNLGLGFRICTLALPRGMNVRKGLKALRRAAPALQVDYDHVYEPAGGALLPATGAALAATAAPSRRGVRKAPAVAAPRAVRIAMIDGGVASHPSLADANIEQRGFVGAPEPTGHGTAIGSLLVGNQGQFRGAARGAQLFVGDVYGGNPAAGSALAIVQALAWAASKQPAVINISLVGPPNRSLERAIAAIRGRGIQLVAAVGNDGPAAPPQYPASYPGVVAVTGVDAADRALREAGRSAHLDFAAPGADLVAALPGNGYTPVRGTSFAAPFVAARLAAKGSPALLAAEAVPGKGKVGRGIVCKSCRILPKMVGLR